MKPTLYRRIREILEAARTGVARSVNTAQVVANWLIGREIVEDEQKGKRRAGYGERLLSDLSRRLQADFGGGYSVDNLEWFRQFYLVYPQLLGAGKSDALRRISGDTSISDAARRKSKTLSLQPKSLTPEQKFHALRGELEIRHTLRGESWQPGQLHLNLAWTHYRTLLRVEKPEARSFYEIEALQNNWSARELERQINSLLYERLALSPDKKGLLRLARKGQEIQGPLDVFKDPLVLEFLKIPAASKLVESDLEAALLNELQSFLLELGKGFAFVARQERITLDGDHFNIDLVVSICPAKPSCAPNSAANSNNFVPAPELQCPNKHHSIKRRFATTARSATLSRIPYGKENNHKQHNSSVLHKRAKA